MTATSNLHTLFDAGILSELDLHFGLFMARLDGRGGPGVSLAAALACRDTRQGHICLDLDAVAGKTLLEREDDGDPLTCPERDGWIQSLEKSPVVGRPGDLRPLILDGFRRLYLYRYWEYEETFAGFVKERVHGPDQDVDERLFRQGLQRLFGPDDFPAGGGQEEVDWQQAAAFTALTKRLCVISGGPGTGKTTTVAKILALMVAQPHMKDAHIVLAAPTGKAAARLQEAIRRSKKRLPFTEDVTAAIPDEASTIHRLLGSIAGSPYFRHHRGNPLPADVVVVDEASMVDLALMAKLVQSLSSRARLVLLGDKDQLASVEAGAVMGDLCDRGNRHRFSKDFAVRVKSATGFEPPFQDRGDAEPRIQDSIVVLSKNYRFGAGSGIGAVSQAINAGEADLAFSLISGGHYKDVSWKDLPSPNRLAQALGPTIRTWFSPFLQASDVGEAFCLFERFRILCVLREGPFGVGALNRLVEQILREQGWIQARQDRWYRGRPILVTSNDYNLELYNGDVGILWPDDQAGGGLRAFFPRADGTFRRFHPLRLPGHETVYAMTVHKSQGAEFDRVLFVLPDRPNPVLTRELLYTGFTRARQSVETWGARAVFRNGVSEKIARMSGLRDRLWGSNDADHP